MTKERRVLLVSDGVVHPPLGGRRELRKALEGLPALDIKVVSSLEVIRGMDLTDIRAMVLYFHHKTISDEALRALIRYVHEGGGLLAVHSATASFKDRQPYFEILGGRFDHHGPVQRIEVLPADADDEVFRGVPHFEVEDELYLHEYDAGNRVHFYAEIEGQQEPIVWTRSYGEGRVSYCSLGHCSNTMRHPTVQQLLQQGLLWACGMEAGGSD